MHDSSPEERTTYTDVKCHCTQIASPPARHTLRPTWISYSPVSLINPYWTQRKIRASNTKIVRNPPGRHQLIQTRSRGTEPRDANQPPTSTNTTNHRKNAPLAPLPPKLKIIDVQ